MLNPYTIGLTMVLRACVNVDKAVVVVAHTQELLDMFGAYWCKPLCDCQYFTWVHTHMAVPDNVTKVFN